MKQRFLSAFMALRFITSRAQNPHETAHKLRSRHKFERALLRLSNLLIHMLDFLILKKYQILLFCQKNFLTFSFLKSLMATHSGLFLKILGQIKSVTATNRNSDKISSLWRPFHTPNCQQKYYQTLQNVYKHYLSFSVKYRVTRRKFQEITTRGRHLGLTGPRRVHFSCYELFFDSPLPFVID